MLTKIATVSCLGLTPVEVDVEVDVAEKGFPSFNIIGLPSKQAEEAKERIKTAIINSLIEFPAAKITINLAPADLPKDGAAFDLPIAIGILASLGKIKIPVEKAYLFGELSLDGGLRHTKGVFLLALAAKENGIGEIFVPRLSANEGAVVKGVAVYPVDSLKSLIRHFNGQKKIERLWEIPFEEVVVSNESVDDFNEIYGQEQAKRAVEVAVAGGHNLIMIGEPGSGKTMLARAMPGIIPDLSETESLEVTKIYSVTGNIPPGGCLIRKRPFRSPHHTTSQVGLIGGGSNPKPGEISLAHRGVLFLDEFPEFSRSCIEALRQPVEDGLVSIARASGKVVFPADFMLVASANPCPCGFRGSQKRACHCLPNQIQNYRKKMSGPIMDRIDIQINVPSVDINKVSFDSQQNRAESSAIIKKRVLMARQKQEERFAKVETMHCNADMKNKQVRQLAGLNQKAEWLLKTAADKFAMSARTYFRVIKVGRTIADLDASQEILEKHIAEALQYRIRGEVEDQ